MLTGKQEKFALLVAEGKSYSDAYRGAYDTNASDRVVYNKGSDLAQRDDIRMRIDELRDEIARRTVLSREKVIQGICDIAFDPKEDESPSEKNVRLKAMDMLAKYLGMYTEKISLTGGIDVASSSKRIEDIIKELK